MSSNEPTLPDEIKCGEQIFDITFHPKFDVLACALIDGAVEIYKYDTNSGSENKLMVKNTNHTGSCRGLVFTDDGERLYTISSDKSFSIMDGTGNTVLSHQDAHDEPINKIISISEGGSVIATGDDGGCVKLWDVRTPQGEVMSWDLHEDFISGFSYHADASTLLSTGGDATLCAYDIRNQKKHNRSDDQEAELQCVEVIKNGRKVICGTQEGVILFFTWGRWGDCSDRFPGHPESVDSILKVDENTVLTGSSDGLLRVVALQPNKVLGVLGDHEEFPVEGMRASRDGRILGSYAHDEVVRFWDISMFADDADDDEDADGKIVADDSDEPADETEEMEEVAEQEEGEKGEDKEEGEWEDMDAAGSESMSLSEDSSDDDDSSDDSDDNAAAGGGGGRKLLPTAAEKFFADL